MSSPTLLNEFNFLIHNIVIRLHGLCLVPTQLLYKYIVSMSSNVYLTLNDLAGAFSLK